MAATPRTLAADASALAQWLSRLAKPPAVLTGAGISTESGLADYRGPNGALAKGHKPQTIQRFLGMPSRTRVNARNGSSDSAELSERTGVAERRRYWARSMLAWSHFAGAEPNAGHLFVEKLRQHGASIVTQNVDGLHLEAGGFSRDGGASFLQNPSAIADDGRLANSPPVVELHGSLHRVVCVACNARERRQDFQHRLVTANMSLLEAHGACTDQRDGTLHFLGTQLVSSPQNMQRKEVHVNSSSMRPDGDIELPSSFPLDSLQIPHCLECGHDIVRPHVVFFGDHLVPETACHARSAVENSGGLLVLGTTLRVFSAFRLVNTAITHGLPVAIVNQGQTRADDEGCALALRIEHQPLGSLLTACTASAF